MFETLDMTKNYEEQTARAKSMISEHDFYEVAKALGFKVELKKDKKVAKKGLTRPKSRGIM